MRIEPVGYDIAPKGCINHDDEKIGEGPAIFLLAVLIFLVRESIKEL
jgi:hypothetical protein